jgi:ribosomal protein S8
VDNKADKQELNKLIADSYKSIQFIKDYLNGEDYEDQKVVSAVKVYLEQLKPSLEKIRQLKYKESMVWYDEDTMTYHLMQSYQTISSLEIALVETKVMSREKPKPLLEVDKSESDEESELSIQYESFD